MAHQTLYPMEKVNLVIWSVSGGAIVNIVFNLFLIPFYGANGAAFSTLVTEIAVFLILLVVGNKYYPFKTSQFFQPSYLIGSLLMGLGVWFSLFIPVSNWVKLIIGVFVGAIIYFAYLSFTKNNFMSFLKNLKLT